MFERFHRVEGARARTHEGSGIGLALTHELVRLHGGDIAVSSRAGAGSTFTVRIPTGRAHLPADRVATAAGAGDDRARGGGVRGGGHRAGCADDAGIAATPAAAARSRADRAPAQRILVADDNADMRDYLRQLLRGWDVETAANGAAALERCAASPPDLVSPT